jgi:hypothetical protein
MAQTALPIARVENRQFLPYSLIVAEMHAATDKGLLVHSGTSGLFTVVDVDVSVVAEDKAGGKGGLNHTPAFEAKVALAAIKGDRTLAQLADTRFLAAGSSSQRHGSNAGYSAGSPSI